MTKTILLLNGPNLNLLGKREPDKYGSTTLSEIEQSVAKLVEQRGYKLQVFQSNAEHLLIERIHQALNDSINYILFNPAAFTHTSVALRDALLSVAIKFSEIHITDPKSREPVRHVSYFSDIATDVVTGKGIDSYRIATENALNYLSE